MTLWNNWPQSRRDHPSFMSFYFRRNSEPGLSLLAGQWAHVWGVWGRTLEYAEHPKIAPWYLNQKYVGRWLVMFLGSHLDLELICTMNWGHWMLWADSDAWLLLECSNKVLPHFVNAWMGTGMHQCKNFNDVMPASAQLLLKHYQGCILCDEKGTCFLNGGRYQVMHWYKSFIWADCEPTIIGKYGENNVQWLTLVRCWNAKRITRGKIASAQLSWKKLAKN
jgi:hypothetical protein